MAGHGRGDQITIVTIFFTSFSSLFVLLRLFTRLVIIRNAGLEDYAIAMSMGCTIAMTCMMVEQVKYGMGKHMVDISQEDQTRALKPFWASILLYNFALFFTKSSILLQYLRIFTIKKFRITCYALLGVVCLYSLWTIFGSAFMCWPAAYYWDKTIQGGKCMELFKAWFANAGINIGTDFAIYFLPMPVLNSLNLRKRAKRGLMGVFALGGFVCLVSILRLKALVDISHSWDPTYDNVSAAIWSCVEINMGIICSCLPTLRPLLNRVFPGAFGTSGPSRGGYESHNRRAGYNRYASGDDTEQISGRHRKERSKGTGAIGLSSVSGKNSFEIAGTPKQEYDINAYGPPPRPTNPFDAIMHEAGLPPPYVGRPTSDLAHIQTYADREDRSWHEPPPPRGGSRRLENEIKVVTVVKQSVQHKGSGDSVGKRDSGSESEKELVKSTG